MQQIVSLLQSSIWFGTVILYGAMGEILTEKSGNLNLGVPGIMSLGAIGGLIGSFFYETRVEEPNAAICLLVTLLCALGLSLFGGLIYSFLTITLRANQNVTGLTLTIFGCGIANFYGSSLNTLAGGVGQISLPVTSAAFRAVLPGLRETPILNTLGWLVYLSILIAIALWYFLGRTRAGLNLRAVGENAATADAAGINVTRCKYLSICVGCAISGLGGLYYTMDYIKGTWTSGGSLEALGWLSVALVIFARWKPIHAIWGSYLFGVLNWLYFYFADLLGLVGISITMTRSSQEIFKMLPYVVTILVLIFVSFRRKREDQPPAGLGLPYFREER